MEGEDCIPDSYVPKSSRVNLGVRRHCRELRLKVYLLSKLTTAPTPAVPSPVHHRHHHDPRYPKVAAGPYPARRDALITA